MVCYSFIFKGKGKVKLILNSCFKSQGFKKTKHCLSPLCFATSILKKISVDEELKSLTGGGNAAPLSGGMVFEVHLICIDHSSWYEWVSQSHVSTSS